MGAEGWYDARASTVTLAVPDVPTGTYLLRVQAGGHVRTQRLVIHR